MTKAYLLLRQAYGPHEIKLEHSIGMLSVLHGDTEILFSIDEVRDYFYKFVEEVNTLVSYE